MFVFFHRVLWPYTVLYIYNAVNEALLYTGNGTGQFTERGDDSSKVILYINFRPAKYET